MKADAKELHSSIEEARSLVRDIVESQSLERFMSEWAKKGKANKE